MLTSLSGSPSVSTSTFSNCAPLFPNIFFIIKGKENEKEREGGGEREEEKGMVSREVRGEREGVDGLRYNTANKKQKEASPHATN